MTSIEPAADDVDRKRIARAQMSLRASERKMVERGRWRAVGIIAVLMAIESVGLVRAWTRLGVGAIPELCIRTAIMGTVLTCLYRGHQWARWVLAAMLVLAILGFRIKIVNSGRDLADEWARVLAISGCVLSLYLLLRSRPLLTFMRKQRGEPA